MGRLSFLTLSALVAACGSTPPPTWPARPFTPAVPYALVADSTSAFIARVREREDERVAGELGEYVTTGGTPVEGTVTTRDGEYRVVGWLSSGDTWATLDARTEGAGDGYLRAEWDAEEGGTLSFSPYSTYGELPEHALRAPISFDAVIGFEPDEQALHVALSPAATTCPPWLFDRLRRELEGHEDFRDEGGRWSWRQASGDRSEGWLVTSDEDECCWDRADWTARAWVEPHCPGRYGLDVDLGPIERECAPCVHPPPGCGGARD